MELKTNIVIEPKFDRKTWNLLRKKLRARTKKRINGIFNYETGEKLINLTSYDFDSCETDTQIIYRFIKVDTHETLHYVIFNITNIMANYVEEKVVEFLCGQEPSILWINRKI